MSDVTLDGQGSPGNAISRMLTGSEWIGRKPRRMCSKSRPSGRISSCGTLTDSLPCCGGGLHIPKNSGCRDMFTSCRQMRPSARASLSAPTYVCRPVDDDATWTSATISDLLGRDQAIVGWGLARFERLW